MKKAKKPVKKTPKAPIKHARTIKVKKKPGKLGSFIHQTYVRLHKWQRWQRVLLYAVTTIIGLLLLSSFAEAVIPKVKDPNYGVSFSVKYAKELGVDWKANFTALLDDMQIKNYRLMSYWDDTEPQQGTFEFSDLDWQMNEAAKRGAKVSLAVGMRQPRWPECHKPHWFTPLNKQQKEAALLAFNKAVVERYRNHPALASYQMENESVNSWFGSCTPDDIDQARLEREFQAIKKLDPNHPVYMSLSDQHGLPLKKPVPDKYGFSVYRIVWNEKTGPFKFYVTYPTPVWYHRLRALWIKTFKNRDIFIHELQVEPWGPAATVDLTIEEQNRSMSPKQIQTNIDFARKIGEKDIYVWGGEWWYWRKTTLKDPSIWDAVKADLNEK